MKNLVDYFNFVLKFDNSNIAAIDKCHNIFLIGSLLSKKPDKVLELGVGSGFVSISLLLGLKYNQKGTLTCVDNWFDWGGVEPKIPEILRNDSRVTFISPMPEEQFVKSAPSDTYDFMVSDADHHNSGNWTDQHMRIVKHDGFMFFHDTNQEDVFPNLLQIEEKIKAKGLPYYHFKENSRSNEHCDRGWLFVINKKD